MSFIAFTEFCNSPTTILSHFGLEGTFSVLSRVHTAAGIARGQISKATQGWLWECRKSHAALAPMWIQKERKPRKKFTSKQVRQSQTSCTGLKGQVSSVDSGLRGILWSAPVCCAGFSHLPLETEWEWTFFPSSKKKKGHRSSQITVSVVCLKGSWSFLPWGLQGGSQCLPSYPAQSVLKSISTKCKKIRKQGKMLSRQVLRWPSSSPFPSVHICCCPCWV